MLLSTDVWVGALIRRAEAAGAFAVVVRKGDPRAGAVLVKVLGRHDGQRQTVRQRPARQEGETVWMEPLAPDADEAAVDAYVERSRQRSIRTFGWSKSTTAQGRHFLYQEAGRGPLTPFFNGTESVPPLS